jgi:hypothetical protein
MYACELIFLKVVARSAENARRSANPKRSIHPQRQLSHLLPTLRPIALLLPALPAVSAKKNVKKKQSHFTPLSVAVLCQR